MSHNTRLAASLGRLIPALLVSSMCTAVLACTHTLYTVEAEFSAGSGKGVVYALPTKQLVVEIDVTTTTTTYGKWVCHNKDVGLTEIEEHNVLCPSKQSPPPASNHKITGTRITDQIVPDPTARFRIQLPNNTEVRGRDRNIRFTLTEDGRLTRSDAEIIDRRPDMAAAGIRTAGAVLGKVIGLVAPGGAALSFAKSSPSGSDACDTDTDTDTSECSAANRLRELWAARDTLLRVKSSTNVPPGPAELERVAHIDREIAELEALFYSTTRKTIQTWVQVVEPKVGETTWTWCRGQGENTVSMEGCVPEDTDSVELTLEGLPTEVKNDVGDAAGIRYRVPRQGQITAVINGSQVVARSSFFPQYGDIQSLPNTARGRYNQLVVELSAATGMLTQFQVVDKRDYSDVIEALGQGLNDTLDGVDSAVSASKTMEAEAASAADPINVKTRELELLELERRLACYDATGEPCP